jgi:hypothetical protein
MEWFNKGVRYEGWIVLNGSVRGYEGWAVLNGSVRDLGMAQ